MSTVLSHRMARPMILVAALAGVALALSLAIRPVTATQPDPHKVTICHRTASESNPYVKITVDEAAVDGDNGNDHGLGDHLLEHLGPVWPDSAGDPAKWGDIIPPFYADGVTLTGYPSLNWDAAGQAIFENDCNPAEQPSESAEGSAEGSQAGGTGTPEGSQGDGALPFTGSSSIPTVAFSLLLLASLGALAYANVRARA